MKVLVTGGRGFIGHNLVQKLDKYDVRVLDNLSSGAENVNDAEFVLGDIRDPVSVYEAMKGVDVVVHLAASGSVIESVADPSSNFSVNCLGTLNVLNEAVKQGVGRFIFASTGGALMGDAEPPVDESTTPSPKSPYGASKLCGEGYCTAFAKSYGLPVSILRFANVYGPNSTHKKGAVNAFIRAAETGNPITIYGDGQASRDFLYVDDLCNGIIAAMESDNTGTYHIASGVETTIEELAAQVKDLVGNSEVPIIKKGARVGEVHRNFSDYSLAARELNFSPEYDLRTGLCETIAGIH